MSCRWCGCNTCWLNRNFVVLWPFHQHDLYQWWELQMLELVFWVLWWAPAGPHCCDMSLCWTQACDLKHKLLFPLPAACLHPVWTSCCYALPALCPSTKLCGRADKSHKTCCYMKTCTTKRFGDWCDRTFLWTPQCYFTNWTILPQTPTRH